MQLQTDHSIREKIFPILAVVLSILISMSVHIGTALADDDSAGSAEDRANITGYVTDATSRETLLGANVFLIGTTFGSSTNTSGYYMVSRIPPGKYTVRYSFIGYAERQIEITVRPGETVRLDVELVPTELMLQELVVETDAFQEELARIGTTQLTTQLIKQMPAVFQADVFRSLQVLPGIKSASDFSSGLYIRGGSPDQTLILLDRTTVYNPTHFFGFFSTFNPDAIKDVRLFKGGYPAEYGGRLGSVVDIYNKDGNRNRTQGVVSLGLLSSRASIEGPYGSGSYMIAARRSTIEPLLAALKNQVDDIPESFYFYDINAKINYDASPNDRLSLSVYAGHDYLNYPIGNDLEFDLTYGNRTVSANYTRILGRSMFANLTVTGSNYFNRPFFEFGGTEFVRNNRVYDYSVKTDLDWIPNQQHSFRIGLWAGNLILRLDDQFDGLHTLSSRIETEYATAFIQDRWKPLYNLTFTLGFRANYFTKGDYFRFEPRASAIYDLTESITLQGAYGRYHQFLTLITNEAFAGFDVWLTTDKGVPPAWGDQFGAGFTYRFAPDWNFETEGYYRTMHDLFELDPRLPDAAGLAYEELFRFGDGYAYGIEVLLERTAGRLNGFLGYTWGNTRRRFPGFNRNNYYPPKYDRIHDLDVVLNYNLSRRWLLTAVFNYATGQAYTEPLGRAAVIGDPFRTGPRDYIIVGNVNASRLPSYHRLDISFSRQGRFFGIADSELQLQIINLYSRRNIWFYSFDFNDNPVKREAVQLLPILPSITYTVFF